MEVTASTLWQLAAEGIGPWFQLVPDGEVHVTTNGWVVLSGEPVADFNIAYVAPGLAAEAQLRDVSRRIHTRGLPAVVLLAQDVGDELAPTALALGLQPVGTMPMMLYTPAQELSTTLNAGAYSVKRVTEAAELEDVKHVLHHAFHLPREALDHVLPLALLDVPGVTFFLTHRGGQPVSTVMTTTTGDIIGIWSMGTPPELQRQGAGQATLLAAIAYHQALGGRSFYLGATAEGKRLYDQVGFRTLEETAVWVAGQSTQFPGAEHTHSG